MSAMIVCTLQGYQLFCAKHGVQVHIFGAIWHTCYFWLCVHWWSYSTSLLPAQFQVLEDRLLDDVAEHSGTSTQQIAVAEHAAHSTIC